MGYEHDIVWKGWCLEQLTCNKASIQDIELSLRTTFKETFLTVMSNVVNSYYLKGNSRDHVNVWVRLSYFVLN